MTATGLSRFRYRWRALLGLAAGLSGGIAAAATGQLPGAAALLGWNIGVAAYLVPTLYMLLSGDADQVRREAGRADEGRVAIMGLILSAVIASLAAIVFALHEARSGHAASGGRPAALLMLCAATLVQGWITVQALFAQHYAHRYFGDRDNDGTADKGLELPGEPPQTYRDFVYVAVCIGATCQVSDFDVTHARFRNLVTTHAAIAFFFNTMILALGINIFGNLMGQ